MLYEGGDPETDPKPKEQTDMRLSENFGGDISRQRTIEKESSGSNILCSDNSDNSDNEHNETRKSLNRANSNESDLHVPENMSKSALNGAEDDSATYGLGISKTIEFNVNKIMIPPPEALIKKSV